ncbi:MAG: redoxin domain-containing protein [Phycisphaerales bacterium]|nr:redoxin domain-containing protein [Planctomycetota bacterium]MCH8508643.1 redoxin domain-containing protein [Phycisphaerales bacterium]
MFGPMKKLFAASAAVAVGGAMIAAGALDHHKAEVGKPAPDFTLKDYNGKEHTLSSYIAQGNIVILEWFNHECPFVVKHYNHENDTFNAMIKEWEDQQVVYLRVNSAATSYTAGQKEHVMKAVENWNITTPILVDADGKVGRMYNAKRTPEMYIINTDGILVYHGAIDNDRSARSLGDVNYVRLAMQDLMAGRAVRTATTTAYGCTVKYGN